MPDDREQPLRGLPRFLLVARFGSGLAVPLKFAPRCRQQTAALLTLSDTAPPLRRKARARPSRSVVPWLYVQSKIVLNCYVQGTKSERAAPDSVSECRDPPRSPSVDVKRVPRESFTDIVGIKCVFAGNCCQPRRLSLWLRYAVVSRARKICLRLHIQMGSECPTVVQL